MLSVRRAIGDDVRNPHYIKTVRGKGFRFIAEVSGRGTPSWEDAYGGPIIVQDDCLSVAILNNCRTDEVQCTAELGAPIERLRLTMPIPTRPRERIANVPGSVTEPVLERKKETSAVAMN